MTERCPNPRAQRNPPVERRKIAIHDFAAVIYTRSFLAGRSVEVITSQLTLYLLQFSVSLVFQLVPEHTSGKKKSFCTSHKERTYAVPGTFVVSCCVDIRAELVRLRRCSTISKLLDLPELCTRVGN